MGRCPSPGHAEHGISEGDVGAGIQRQGIGAILRDLDKPSRFSQTLVALALAFCAARSAFTWEKLPPVMASHFGPGGVADGASSKGLFFLLYGTILLVVLVSLLGSVVLMEKLPLKYLNLPHKEYWAEGRMDEARKRMSAVMWQMAAGTMLLMAATLELVIHANIQRGNLNENLMWLLLGGYLVFTLVWTVNLLRTFRPPDAAS